MIMEAEKSQGLQLASWRLRGTSGISSSLKAGRPKTQEELMFQFKSIVWKKTISQCEEHQAGDVTLTHGRASLFVLFRPSTD